MKLRPFAVDNGDGSKMREPGTRIGTLMLRYLAHVTGHDVYPAARWREFISKGQT